MAFRKRIGPAGAAALVGSMLEAGATSAHAGEYHAASGWTNLVGLGLLIAMIIVAAVGGGISLVDVGRAGEVRLQDTDVSAPNSTTTADITDSRVAAARVIRRAPP